jgi:hypothetical protein
MKRDEAIDCLGKRVAAWTAMNGSYSGILVKVTDDKPWRGVVVIDGVIECWCLYEIGRKNQRKGLILGNEYDFGCSSIALTDYEGISKRAILEQEIEYATKWINDPFSKHYHADVPKKIKEYAYKQLKEMFNGTI